MSKKEPRKNPIKSEKSILDPRVQERIKTITKETISSLEKDEFSLAKEKLSQLKDIQIGNLESLIAEEDLSPLKNPSSQIKKPKVEVHVERGFELHDKITEENIQNALKQLRIIVGRIKSPLLSKEISKMGRDIRNATSKLADEDWETAINAAESVQSTLLRIKKKDDKDKQQFLKQVGLYSDRANELHKKGKATFNGEIRDQLINQKLALENAVQKAEEWSYNEAVDSLEMVIKNVENLEARLENEQIFAEFDKSTKHLSSDLDLSKLKVEQIEKLLPEAPILEPGVMASGTGKSIELTDAKNRKKTFKVNRITELTLFEFVNPDKEQKGKVHVTFYERGAAIAKKDRTDFAKMNKYQRGAYHEGTVPANQVKGQFNILILGGKDIAKKQYPVFGKKGPTLQDIKQGISGQCWLLSPLMAMVRKDPKLIKDAFVHIDDKTASIKFFGQKGPELVRVSRDIVKVKILGMSYQVSSEKGHENSCWPMLYLKAYAAWGGKNDQGTDRNFTVQSLDGGQSSVAFSHFIGAGSQSSLKNSEGEGVELPTDAGALKKFLTENGIDGNTLEDKGKYAKDFKKWETYTKKPSNKTKLGKVTKGNVTLEQLAVLLKSAGIIKSDLGKEILKLYGQYYRNDGTPELLALGIPRYTKASIAFYEELEKKLHNKVLISAGTHSDEFVGHDGKIKKGRNAVILGGTQKSHAYEVVAVSVKKDKKTEEIIERYVKLRNPWGKRRFTGGDAEFDMTLSKFLRRFSDIYYGE